MVFRFKSFLVHVAVSALCGICAIVCVVFASPSHLQIRDSLSYPLLLYCAATVLVSIAFLLTTAFLTSHLASPSGVDVLLARIVRCIIGDHPYLESVTCGAHYLSCYRNLSYTDAVCGAALNTLLWHKKRSFGCNLAIVKNMKPHEYLNHIYTEHSKCKRFRKKIVCSMDDRAQRELSHFVEYAVAIYGRAMWEWFGVVT